MSNLLHDVPGPRAKRSIVFWNIGTGILVAAGIAWLLVKLGEKGQLSTEWSIVYDPTVLKLFGSGLLATLLVAVCGMTFSLLFGLVLAAGRLSRKRWLRGPARAAVELFRGLPVLMLIFLIYLGLPIIGIVIPSFWALVLGVSLYNGALIAEIYRSGILALPRGQTEAAESIGLRPGQVMRYILLPQAIRSMLPALISQLVVIVKESSLGFIVGYTDLARDGNGAVNFLGTLYTLPIYTEIAAIYIVINVLLSQLAKWIERRSRQRYGRSLGTAMGAE